MKKLTEGGLPDEGDKPDQNLIEKEFEKIGSLSESKISEEFIKEYGDFASGKEFDFLPENVKSIVEKDTQEIYRNIADLKIHKKLRKFFLED